MIERQIEAPVLPGDNGGPFRLLGEPEPVDAAERRGEMYIEPGGLVDIAVRELGGEVTSVELLPDEEP
jgi:hypothetical protein